MKTRRGVHQGRAATVFSENLGAMSVETFVLLAVLGLVVGAVGTLVGAGGGFILTPVLLALYPTDSPETITAISLVAVFFNSLSGSLAYARQRRIDYSSGIVFATCTLPGAVAGALAVTIIPRQAFDLVMAALLAGVSAWLLLGRSAGADQSPRAAGSPREITDSDGHVYRYAVPVRRGAAYSVVVGFASSFLGIGGGVLHVPLLTQALGFPTHIATATSHFILAFMAGTASLTHVLSGSFQQGHGLHRAAALSIGVVAGAQVGAVVSRRTSGRTIHVLLAVALALLAARLVVGGLR